MSPSTEQLVRQALTGADSIGTKAWAELVYYYRVSGVVEMVVGVAILLVVVCIAMLLAKSWDDLNDPEMFAIFGGMVGGVALLISLWLVGEGITYLLAPGGAALHGALQ